MSLEAVDASSPTDEGVGGCSPACGRAKATRLSPPNRARLVLREMVDRPHETRELVGGAVAPWLQLVVHTIEDGVRAGRIRPEVDPIAFVMECIALIIGTFAAADLAAGLSPGESRESAIDRQFDEILRIARTSLFTEGALADMAGSSTSFEQTLSSPS